MYDSYMKLHRMMEPFGSEATPLIDQMVAADKEFENIFFTEGSVNKGGFNPLEETSRFNSEL